MNIKFDLTKTAKKLRTPWNFGVNSCHAVLWKRQDLIHHAEITAKKCGFRYIRFHNTLSRQMNIYSEDENGNPQLNFKNFDIVFDNVIASGYIPFFEISFCPDALSDEIKELCFYKANTSLPNSLKKWKFLITNIIEHLIDRYGLEFVKKMYFEVWNEPDLIFLDGTMEDYFELYDHTVTAIKAVNADLRVGGPATSKCAWIGEFVKHIEGGLEITGGKPVPCDFISTHAYPSDLPFLNSDRGNVELQESEVMHRLFSEVKSIVESSSLKGLPIIMGEWNSSAGPFAYNHDEKNNGAFIIKTCIDLKDIIDGSMYWNLTDIYEESGFHYVPFHGGYGLTNINDIPKSSFHAFSMLNELKGIEIPASYGEEDVVRAIAAYDEDNDAFKILLYYYCEPSNESKDVKDVSVSVFGIACESVSAEITSVSSESGSAYEWWQKLDCPQFLNKDKLDFLLQKSQPITENKNLFKNKINGEYTLNFVLEAGDFALITFKNV